MPQGTNLNTSPYYDDFDKTKNYYKVLFKPGFPVQARELTSLQSIFQNQVESFGNYFFKEGSVVIPGGVVYQNYFYAVEIQSSFAGIDVGNYLNQLEGRRIRGASSNIIAKVVKVLPSSESERNSNTLYVMYETSGGSDSTVTDFFDAENLLLESDLTYGTTTIASGEAFAVTKTSQATSIASSVTVNSGVYYVRGTFVDVPTQVLILDQYSNTPSYRVGFNIVEEIITASEDGSLFDNSLGSSNFSAPGADRLKISLILTKKPLDNFNDENFIEILRVNNGTAEIFNNNTQLNLIKNELAKRTFDESGDYVVKPFGVSVKESLNDFISNNGIYNDPQILPNLNIASDDVLIYQVTPGKAYVKGFDVNSPTSTFLDIEKPRDSREVYNISIPYNSGLSVNVNRVYGTPIVGLGTTGFLSLRDSRISSNPYLASGNEIGVARVYDFTPIETYQNDSSVANLRLFDIQTYTTLTLSSNITLSTPCLVAGNNSGAKGYLRTSVSNSSTLTLYQVSGNFIRNEQLIINGETNGRLITNVKDYSLSDVKSVYSLVGVSTFNADLVLSSRRNISQSGTIFNISASSGGISTISSPGLNFVGIASVGNIISYGNVGFSQTSIIYNKIESIGSGGTSITVSEVQTVNGVNNGSLPTSNTTISNLSIISPEFSNRENSSLFTPLSNLNVSEVNFKNSEIFVKTQFSNLTVSSSSIVLNLTDPNLFFENFDGLNYYIAYSDGTVERSLRSDKFTISNGGKTLTISDLSVASGTCRVSCVLRKINSTSKNKTLNRANSITIFRSSLISSGIGSTTLNDGLTYSNVYGTRVQDSEISLNVPDVVRVLAIYESSGTSEPQLPTLTLNSFTGPNNSTVDYITGESVMGESSKSVAIIVNRSSSNQLEIVYLNSNKFIIGETITSLETNISSVIVSSNIGDKEITNNYNFDNGQRDHIYDYSRIIRKSQFTAPIRKIKIIFQNYTISSTDSGDLITASSYSPENYNKNIPSHSGYRNTDIIDIRPRVSEYSLSSTLSPFEFSARNFSTPGGFSSYILSPNSNLITNYKYYLPRIDKIFLTKDGNFIISRGTSDDNPGSPITVSDALEIATIFLPAYLYDVKDARIVLSKNRRYTMSDISNLENRIERTERLTTLSLLELDAKNYTIRDASTGLDRFKTGIFVDNFKSHKNHDITDINFRASIDKTNAILRPQTYSTSLDLQLGSESILGISTQFSSNADLSYVFDLGDSNVQKTGDLITLSYDSVVYKTQPFATRIENVTPFLVTLWEGSVNTVPSSDNWINERTTSTTSTTGNYNEIVSRLGVDARTGLSDVDYIGNYQQVLQGIDSNVRATFDSEVITSSETGTRTGTQFIVNENISTRVDTREYTESIRFIRERNIEFTGVNLKPFTQHYAFFDNVDVSSYIVPKLLEIEMISGTFVIGETVRTRVINAATQSSGNPFISFRLCAPNHRSGDYNAPSDYYIKNPYNETDLEINYSSTSEILNVDTRSLQLPSESSFYGWISVGMEVIGQTSNAVARIKNIRIFTDNIGKVVASLYIPDSSIPNLPKFETGTKVLRLTTLRGNQLNLPGSSESAGEGTFSASGTLRTRETQTTTIRDARVTVRTIVPQPIIISPVPQPIIDSSGNGGEPLDGRVIGFPPVLPPITPETVVNPTIPQTENLGTIYAVGLRGNVGVYNSRNIYENGTLYISGSTGSIVGSAGPTWATSLPRLSNRFIRTVRNDAATLIRNGNMEVAEAATVLRSASDFAGSYQRTLSVSQERSAQRTFIRAEQQYERNVARQADIRIARNAASPGSCPKRDPLAQSFTVDEPSGVFLSGVGVFFYTKDSRLPVTLQIRTVEGGVPTEEVVAFSEVNLDPIQVFANSTQLTETIFTFDSPVYLPGGGKEYAIVLLSNSTDYTVYIARMGEVDVSTIQLPESQRIVVSRQPTLGSLFKSQNASTWTPSQYEDLKYNLYRCSFVTNPGTVKFFNPKLDIGNDKIPRLGINAITTLSKKVTVGLGSTGYDPTNVVPGVIIIQGNARGDLVSIGGSALSLSLSSAGIGYTPSSGSFTYNNVSFTSLTGNGKDIVGIVTVTDGLVTGAVVTQGGTNYVVGDILSVPSLGTGIGTGSRFTVASIGSSNTFNLDNVQGEFSAGITTLTYINSAGITTVVGVGVTAISVLDDRFNDGLHLKINHRNHSMHSSSNIMRLYNVPSNITPITLSSEISSNQTGNIAVSNSSGFETFEGVGIGSTNPGYILIGDEIISYTSVESGVIGIQSRGVDGTQAILHPVGSEIYKYELNNVSLRRINTSHNFALVDNTDVHNIDLDSYYVKIDMSKNGTDRSVGTSFPKLFFDKTSLESSESSRATENIQFDTLIPTFRTLVLPNTDINARVRTISATSIDGSEESFLDQGFENINLNAINFFRTPRLIASQINEDTFLDDIPGNKSLSLEVNLTSNNNFVSPVIDLEQTNIVLSSNRINNPILDYANDGRVNSLTEDPHSAIYTSNRVFLKNPADSLKVLVSAKLAASNGIRVLYRLFRNDAPETEQTWQLFPGYQNIDSLGNTINSELSDGTSDSQILPQSYGDFVEYEYTSNNLPQFEGYQIKIVMYGSNQAEVPQLSELRVIATA